MVKVENLQKSYKKRRVLSGVSFEAKPGERIVFVGRNGCGKTTLLQILSGAIKPEGGEICYFGADPLQTPRLFGRYCGYVPQENPLLEELSVLDNLRLWGFRKKEMHPLLEEFDLMDLLRVKVERLSGGMKRRLSIACACVNRPPILILDEPTAALDLYYRSEILFWLKSYQSRGGIVLMSSHEEAEIAEASQCMILKDGGCINYPEEVRSMQRILEYTKEGD